jgi:hypothetical protein
MILPRDLPPLLLVLGCAAAMYPHLSDTKITSWECQLELADSNLPDFNTTTTVLSNLLSANQSADYVFAPSPEFAQADIQYWHLNASTPYKVVVKSRKWASWGRGADSVDLTVKLSRVNLSTFKPIGNLLPDVKAKLENDMHCNYTQVRWLNAVCVSSVSSIHFHMSGLNPAMISLEPGFILNQVPPKHFMAVNQDSG